MDHGAEESQLARCWATALRLVGTPEGRAAEQRAREIHEEIIDEMWRLRAAASAERLIQVR